MSHSDRRRFLRVKFKRSKDGGEDTEKSSVAPPKTSNVGNPKSGFPTFDEPNRSKQTSGLRQKAYGDRLEKVKVAGGMPPRSNLDVFSNKSMKSQNVAVDKLSTRNAALLEKEVSSHGTVSASFMQKEHVSGRFLSVLVGRGRLIKNTVATQLLGRKVRADADNVRRLPHAKRIQLFQTLLNGPVTFLDLHGRFGVSKQTIKRLVKNGLLVEDWGPRAIGVRFRLSKKGKTYLKELEAAALYESNVEQKNFIRLKSKS